MALKFKNVSGGALGFDVYVGPGQWRDYSVAADEVVSVPDEDAPAFKNACFAPADAADEPTAPEPVVLPEAPTRKRK